MGDPWQAWATTWRTGQAFAETWRAAAQVVVARGGLIGAALANPAAGDWPELGRMMPEKVAALSEAGQAVALDLARLQADALKLWVTLAAMMAAGRPPTMRETGALIARMAAGQEAALGAGGRALAPVRRRVAANARRLRA